MAHTPLPTPCGSPRKITQKHHPHPARHQQSCVPPLPALHYPIIPLILPQTSQCTILTSTHHHNTNATMPPLSRRHTLNHHTNTSPPRGTSVHHHYNCWHPQLNAHIYHLNSTISTTLLTLQSILCFLHDATKNQLPSTDDQPLLPTFINTAFLHAQKHPPKGTLSNKRHNYPQPYQISINPHYDWQTHPTLHSRTEPHTPLHPTAAHYSALIPNLADDTRPATYTIVDTLPLTGLLPITIHSKIEKFLLLHTADFTTAFPTLSGDQQVTNTLTRFSGNPSFTPSLHPSDPSSQPPVQSSNKALHTLLHLITSSHHSDTPFSPRSDKNPSNSNVPSINSSLPFHTLLICHCLLHHHNHSNPPPPPNADHYTQTHTQTHAQPSGVN